MPNAAVTVTFLSIWRTSLSHTFDLRMSEFTKTTAHVTGYNLIKGASLLIGKGNVEANLSGVAFIRRKNLDRYARTNVKL